jgi:UPF0271 protein
MMNGKVELNCDLGEGMPYDAALMPYLGSCNIACGGHTGDEKSILNTIRLAKKHQVKIGAHPSYPDRTNFGRLPLSIPFSSLKKSLIQQIEQVRAIGENENFKLNHIKFHGALYLHSLSSQKLARKLAGLLANEYRDLMLYAPFGSIMAQEAVLHNIPLKYEGFADRAYLTGSTLLGRKEPNALLMNLKEIEQQVVSMINSGSVSAINKKKYTIKTDTICVHGDHPKALEIVQMLSSIIRKNNER